MPWNNRVCMPAPSRALVSHTTSLIFRDCRDPINSEQSKRRVHVQRVLFDGAPGQRAHTPGCTAVMSKWWRKVQESLPKPSSIAKNARKNASFVQKKYGEDVSKRGRSILPESVRVRSAELGRQARERAEEAASRLAGRAKALPSKAAEVRKRQERKRARCRYVSASVLTWACAATNRKLKILRKYDTHGRKPADIFGCSTRRDCFDPSPLNCIRGCSTSSR